MLDELLPYYERELTMLRQLSKEFAAQYPKIASRLLLEGDTCADPHVERLIEAFSFLTARIHRKLDDEFPEITDAFLGVLYPHYLQPIPSMSIVQFQIAPDKAQLTGRYIIPRHTPLASRPVSGMPCRFRTCYPVDLWPIRVADARVEPIERSAFALRPSNVTAVVRIKLNCVGDVAFSALRLDRLRFFLDGENPLVHALYELLCNSVRQVILASGETRVALPAGSLRPVGFAADEGMLDYDDRSFPGYRLLHEYFAFPDKFLFVDVANLDRAANFGKDMEILVLLGEFERQDRLPRLVQTVNVSTFRLGCTPIVNLFQQAAEPIRLTHEKTEYQVIPDIRRPWGMEVYSVDSVRNVVQTQRKEEVIEFQPFYSLRHALQPEAQHTFWYAVRRSSSRKDDLGTEVHLSLVDLQFNPSLPAVETLSVTTTCTNRDLPGLLPFGGEEGDFEMEGSSVVSRIRCLRKPTPTVRPRLGRGAMWRLISHLSLNHLSLVEGGREALLEILSLYNFSDSSVIRKQISGITRVSSGPCVARVGSGQRLAFVRGTEVELEFDEDQYIGSGIYLLASLLERFFGLYCAVNSFTRLKVTTKQRERMLAQWPPRTGEAILV
jgi:type VI secretion system protein ImpG